MKRHLGAILLVAAAYLTGIAAKAGPPSSFSNKAFDAIYARTNSTGVCKYRMCSDGQGHMRTETELPGESYKQVVIFDYPRRQMLFLLEQQKMVMKMPLTSDTKIQPDDAQIQAMGGETLGKRMIDGHPCHGWKYEMGGKQCETWIADDLGCMFVTASTDANGEKEILHLIEFSKSAPPLDEFAPPADYRQMASTGAMH